MEQSPQTTHRSAVRSRATLAATEQKFEKKCQTEATPRQPTGTYAVIVYCFKPLILEAVLLMKQKLTDTVCDQYRLAIAVVIIYYHLK